MARGRSHHAVAHGAVSIFAVMAAASAPSPFYPVLAARLHLSSFAVTLVFAVYVLAQVGALLTVASISDHVGRRPAAAGGLVVLAASMMLLWTAGSAGQLVAGRVLQGAATGVLLSTLSAVLSDSAGPGGARRAALLSGLAPMLGLAAGAVLSSVALTVAPGGAAAVFPALAALDLLLAVLTIAAPETSARRPGIVRSLRPDLHVPSAARRAFASALPVVVASWATGGLFLSLGATIVTRLLAEPGHLAGGLVIGALPAAGAAAQLVLRRGRPEVVSTFGAAALAVGTALMLVALETAAFPLYVVAVVIGGAGFGTAFTGTIGRIAPLAAQAERAGLFAALYTVSYLGFGLPAVLAGALADAIGLRPTVLGYGALVVALALAAVLLGVRGLRGRPAPVPAG